MMIRALVLFSLFAAHSGPADASVNLTPGLYEVQVEIALPNTYNVAPKIIVRHCVTAPDIATGRAFFVLSDNPIRSCSLHDYDARRDEVRYRIACAGPNAASASAAFELQQTHYHGTIHMQMGGKNMTMFETQHAVRVGECE